MPPTPNQLSVDDFAARIKAKYPAYENVPNQELVTRMVSKYPQYRSMVAMPASSATQSVTQATPTIGPDKRGTLQRLEDWYTQPGKVYAGTIGKPAESPEQHADELAKGAQVSTLPLLGAGLATAPMETLLTLLTGTVGAKAGGYLGHKAGAHYGAPDLGADVGAGVGGVLAGGKSALDVLRKMSAPAAVSDAAMAVMEPEAPAVEVSHEVPPAAKPTSPLTQEDLNSMSARLDALAKRMKPQAPATPAAAVEEAHLPHTTTATTAIEPPASGRFGPVVGTHDGITFTRDTKNNQLWAHGEGSPNPISVPDTVAEADQANYARTQLQQQAQMAAQLRARLAKPEEATPEQHAAAQELGATHIVHPETAKLQPYVAPETKSVEPLTLYRAHAEGGEVPPTERAGLTNSLEQVQGWMGKNGFDRYSTFKVNPEDVEEVQGKGETPAGAKWFRAKKTLAPVETKLAEKPAVSEAKPAEPAPPIAALPEDVTRDLKKQVALNEQLRNPELTEAQRGSMQSALKRLSVADRLNAMARKFTGEDYKSLGSNLRKQVGTLEQNAGYIEQRVADNIKNHEIEAKLNERRAAGYKYTFGAEQVGSKPNDEPGTQEYAVESNPEDEERKVTGRTAPEMARPSRALIARLQGKAARPGDEIYDAKPAPKGVDPAEWEAGLKFAEGLKADLEKQIADKFVHYKETEDPQDLEDLQDLTKEYDEHVQNYFRPRVSESNVGKGNRAYQPTQVGPNGELSTPSPYKPITLEEARQMLGTKVNKIPADETLLSHARKLRAHASQLKAIADWLDKRHSQAGFAAPDLLGLTVAHDLGVEMADIAASAGVQLHEVYKAVADFIAPTHDVRRDAVDAMATADGEINKRNYLARATLREHEKAFDRMPDADRIAFIDRYKSGQQQPSPELQHIADVIRQVDEDDAKAIESVRGADNFHRLENHFRVLYRRIPGRTEEGFRNWLNARRPLEGTRGFLKAHTFDTLSDAMKAGGIPITTNPITMWRLSHADVLRYVQANALWDWAKDSGARTFVKTGERVPPGFVRLHDRISKVYFPAASGEGMVSPGEWFVDEGFGRLLNNYLSNDRFRAHALGRTALDAKNISVGWQLFGPYHAVRMTGAAISSDMAQAASKFYNIGVRQGDVHAAFDAFRDFLESPGAPVRLYKAGMNAMKYMENKQALLASDAGKQFLRENPGAADLIDDAFFGGLNLERHSDYTSQIVENMLSDFSNGRYIHGALRAPGVALYQSMRPLFDNYIPRLKWGAFMRDMSQALEERSDDLATGKLTRTELARQVAGRVDNAFGELNLDRMFWNRTFKSLMQLNYTAASWRLGKARLLSDAVTDQFSAIRESMPKLAAAKTPRAYLNALPRLSSSFAYILGDAALTGLASAVIMKMYAHKNPSSARDLLYPRIGGVDAHGKPLRVTLPSMVGRELQSAVQHPLNYVMGGQTELWTRLAEAARNKDFFGQQVHNPDDPKMKQFTDVLFHLVPPPMAIDNIRRMQQTGATKSQGVLSVFGATPASTRTDLTPAEHEAQSRAARYYEQGPVTKQEYAARQLKSQIVASLRNNDTKYADQLFEQGLKDSSLQMSDMDKLMKRAQTPYLIELANQPGLTLPDLAAIVQKATPQEKEQLLPIVEAKAQRQLPKLPPEQAEKLSRLLDQEFAAVAH